MDLVVSIYCIRSGQIVNVASAFEKMNTKQYNFTGKQRLLLLGTIGIIAMLITVYIATGDVEVAVGPNPPNSNSFGAGKTLAKSENQQLPVVQGTQVIRDPFALPPEVKEQNNETGRVPTIPSNVPSYTPTSVPGMVPKSVIPNNPSANLKLTGIVGTAGRNLAVIISDNKSKSYSVNDFIGAYKIMAISNDYVILANGDSKVVLRLETSGQRGGNSSEK